MFYENKFIAIQVKLDFYMHFLYEIEQFINFISFYSKSYIQLIMLTMNRTSFISISRN